MNNLREIQIKLSPITVLTIDAARVTGLSAVRDITYHLQMTYYWLKYANAEMMELSGELISTEEREPEEHEVIIPNIKDALEQFNYIRKQLDETAREVFEYITETSLPAGVKYKTEQAYNNIMQAVFNTEISTVYYESLRRQQTNFGEPGFTRS
jgi:hypothetical protein